MASRATTSNSLWCQCNYELTNYSCIDIFLLAFGVICLTISQSLQMSDSASKSDPPAGIHLPVTNNPDSSNDWPAVLKDWRKRKGFTQKQAAEFCGVALRTYEQWEHGIAKPTMIAPISLAEIIKDRI